MATSFGSRLGAALLLAALSWSMPALADAKAAQAAVCDDDAASIQERIAACTAVIGDASTPPSDRAEALATRGELHGDAKDHDRAIADLTAAIAIDPKMAGAFILRGNAFDAKGEADKALADYEAAIRLEPNDPVGYFNRAEVHQAKGNVELAQRDYARALEIDPAYEGARQALADLQARK